MDRKINTDMFCRKLPDIDFKNIQLRPQKTLEFCAHPEPETKTVSAVDPRYLENDSRYITPEDKEKYRIEFENLLKEREEKCSSQDFHIPIEHKTFKDYFDSDPEINDSERDEEETDEENYEDGVDEYEFRSN